MDGVSITSFTYCDKVQQVQTPNGIVSQIISPLQALLPVSIPSNYTFSIVCMITGVKYNPENRLRVTFEDPKGEVIQMLEQQNCNPPEGLKDQDESYSMQLEMELRNIILEQTGEYCTRIIFNSQEIGHYKISVNIPKTISKEA